jgi:hypothetical protein
MAISCTLSGMCEIIESLENGDYYAAGYGTAQVAADAALTAGGFASGGAGTVAGVASRVAGTAARAGRLAAKLCSFTAATDVLMADGTTTAIADIDVGDQVWATDPQTGREGPRAVQALWVHTDTVVDLQVENGVVTTTEDHPFWNHTDQQWQRADALDPGDQLLTHDGTTTTTITVTALHWDSVRTDTAYNLTVDDIHNYYVLAGNTPVLVHNCGGEVFGPGKAGPLSDDIANTFMGGTYRQTTLNEPVNLYRVYGGQAGELGSYWSRTPQNGALQSQLDLSLNPAWGTQLSKWPLSGFREERLSSKVTLLRSGSQAAARFRAAEVRYICLE